VNEFVSEELTIPTTVAAKDGESKSQVSDFATAAI
jgi:hypothetical protein